MKINQVSSAYANPVSNINRNHHISKINNQPTTDTVAFKGVKNAVKGGALLGLIGAAVGAIVSGGTSVLATIAYFATCNGIIGAVGGAHTEDD